jgi:cytochrome c peroxidase
MIRIPIGLAAEPIHKQSVLWLLGLLGLLGLLWLAPNVGNPPQSAPVSDPLAERDPGTGEPIAPLPLTVSGDPAKEALGDRLFGDVRLSGDGSMSCRTCHQLRLGGADALPVARRTDGSSLARNTPTVFNVGFNYFFNWDGSTETLEVHAERLISNVEVMHASWPELLRRLRDDTAYLAAFDASYPDGLTKTNVLAALAAYERSLFTPNSRFDQYLRGRREALTQREERGYRLFKSYGCVACHQGMNVGGNMVQKFGVFPSLPTPAPSGTPGGPIDLGRFQVTQVERDRRVFRVPSLRNVALTAPYFHNGRAATLESAIDTMARVQLGKTLTADEIDAISGFLRTLTGEYRGQPLSAFSEGPG